MPKITLNFIANKPVENPLGDKPSFAIIHKPLAKPSANNLIKSDEAKPSPDKSPDAYGKELADKIISANQPKQADQPKAIKPQFNLANAIQQLALKSGTSPVQAVAPHKPDEVIRLAEQRQSANQAAQVIISTPTLGSRPTLARLENHLGELDKIEEYRGKLTDMAIKSATTQAPSEASLPLSSVSPSRGLPAPVRANVASESKAVDESKAEDVVPADPVRASDLASAKAADSERPTSPAHPQSQSHPREFRPRESVDEPTTKSSIVSLTPTSPASPSTTPASFQWDDSQLKAIDSILDSQFSCLIGAAGSGKTTVVKEIVSRLESLGEIKPLTYERANGLTRDTYNVSFVSFTGKAVEQLRKAIPPRLQCCCETIHSLLEYAPEVRENLITREDGSVTTKESRVFVPRRTESVKLPQDIIFIDESGMVGIELWNNLWRALDKSKPNLKIVLIGDIYQLPAVIGKSILGFALNSPKWSTSILTKIHRQALDNPIIANAHRIKSGLFPNKSATAQGTALQPFAMKNIGELTESERKRIREGQLGLGYFAEKNRPHNALKISLAIIKKLYEKGEYDPRLDQIIVPQNVGTLGQEMLNQHLAPLFNSANQRIPIKASYETKFLAVGDKVMFTKNDYKLGILNGMTGYITRIALNGDYKDYIALKQLESTGYKSLDFTVTNESQELAEKALAEIDKFGESMSDGEMIQAEQEASHVVTVRYTPLGSSEESEIAVSKVGQIRGMLLAYAITCHKAQGSEYRRVIVIAHSSNGGMLSREWLYTAVTRARENLILLYNELGDKGLARGLRRQVVKGETIEEKAHNFSLAEAAESSAKYNENQIPLGIFTNEEMSKFANQIDMENNDE